jgi:hypothetical protein
MICDDIDQRSNNELKVYISIRSDIGSVINVTFIFQPLDTSQHWFDAQDNQEWKKDEGFKTTPQVI